MNQPVRHINPFRDTAFKYREKGWYGTIPLPYKDKFPPPTGYIGHNAPHPDDDRVQRWCNGEDLDRTRSNIGIRLAGVTKEYEILGIDVDHYTSGKKVKTGHDQLKDLESKFGELPATWTSSSRVDGKSGIRYFLVPRGFAYRGKISADIECISKGTRFAVVWPSIHPDGPTYWWFPPNVSPDKNGRDAWDGQIPLASDLPQLPKAWHDYLTQGGMRADAKERIDMDASIQEIYDWADATFYGDDDAPLCTRMAKTVQQQIADIEGEATSHDKIVKAHWHIYRLAAEGHNGWNKAVNEIEQFYAQDTIQRGKRNLSEVRNEIFRSRTNGLRKIKAQIDGRIAIGANAVDPSCLVSGACVVAGEVKVASGRMAGLQARLDGDDDDISDENDDSDIGDDSSSADSDSDDSGEPPDGLEDVPRGPIRPVDEYEMNDDGNAQHFVDLFSFGDSNGASVRFADGYGWIVWHSGNPVTSGSGLSDSEPHWELDPLGDQEIRRMWQRVKKRQINYVEQALYPDYITQLTQAQAAGGPIPPAVKAAKAKYEDWKRFAQASGNNRNAENAIKAVKSIPSVSISVNELDRNPYLLGVRNGVVELDSDNVRLRKAQASDYITLNTGTPFEAPSKFAQEKWNEYLDTFLPNRELQRATQIALGHCLIGGNPEKIMLVLKGNPNTGKSTMVNTIEKALGDYAMTVNTQFFQSHKFNVMMAEAIQKRVVICSEFDEEEELSASIVKRITGGTDKVTQEIKFSNAKIEGIPQYVPILATNGTPRILGADKALENRLFIIPFNITPDRVDKQAASVVTSVCATACLNWLIEGYVEYRRIGGLVRTREIEEISKEFVAELDEVATFVHECVTEQTNPIGAVTRKAMYDRFERWWLDNNYKQRIISRPLFKRRLSALGLQSRNNRHRFNGELDHWWMGVKLKEPDRVVLKMPSFDNIKTENEKNGSDDNS